MRLKADISQLSVLLGRPELKKWGIKKKLKIETDMLRSVGKQSGESVESVLRKKKAAVGRNC